MSKRMFAEAERIIGSLGIGSYLYDHRDDLRKQLMGFWKSSENGRRFVREALLFIDYAIQKVVSVQTYKDVSLSISPDRARANRKITQFVLYFVLERAVVECVWNLEEWREMKCVARNELFDPELLIIETEYFVQSIPGLAEIIASEFGDIEHELREEYELRHQGSMKERLLHGVSVLGDKFLMREELNGSVAHCVEELRAYAQDEGSALTLLKLYVVYYAFSKCPKVQDIKWAVDRFEEFILEEIGRCR